MVQKVLYLSSCQRKALALLRLIRKTSGAAVKRWREFKLSSEQDRSLESSGSSRSSTHTVTTTRSQAEWGVIVQRVKESCSETHKSIKPAFGSRWLQYNLAISPQELNSNMFVGLTGFLPLNMTRSLEKIWFFYFTVSNRHVWPQLSMDLGVFLGVAYVFFGGGFFARFCKMQVMTDKYLLSGEMKPNICTASTAHTFHILPFLSWNWLLMACLGSCS